MKKTILWWGRSDLEYPRNRLIIKLLKELNYNVIFYKPLISSLGYFQAILTVRITPSLIWVPCFRHKDFISAHKWSIKNNIPIIFDPFISKWDKLINEKNKFIKNSSKAHKIKNDESLLFKKANLIVADTEPHKNFFSNNFNIPKKNIYVINVGAEENLFKPMRAKKNKIKEILFYGSFIELHGIETIINAVNLINKKFKLILLGNYYKEIKDNRIQIESSIPFEKLPERINKADILLGIFGHSEKAGNVIPNKVYQSMACGKPIITRYSNAYPKKILDNNHGLIFIKPNNPKELANTIKKILSDEKLLLKMGNKSKQTFDQFFSEDIIKVQIQKAISKVIHHLKKD